jgi:hypothetical protein
MRRQFLLILFSGYCADIFASFPAGSSDEVGTREQSNRHIIYGARLSMATAYQSCDVLKIPELCQQLLRVIGMVAASRYRDWGAQRMSEPNACSISGAVLLFGRRDAPARLQ